MSLYGATKKANEAMAYSYSSLFGISCVGLRFFTVYGPWGRPDMAYYSFTKKIFAGETIDVFNHRRMRSDFTCVDDVVESLVRLLSLRAEPYRIYNIGNHRPVELGRFIEVLESLIGRKAEKRFLPMQSGDVPETFADVEDLIRDTGFSPNTDLKDGLAKFVAWYRYFHKV